MTDKKKEQLEKITGYYCPKCKEPMLRDNVTGHWCPRCELISDRIRLRDFKEIFIEHEVEAYNRLRDRVKKGRDNGDV